MTRFKPTCPNSRSYRFIARGACVIALAIGAASLATAIPAQAKNSKHGQGEAHCPPGLAKKSVPCVPPGQVKSSNHGWQSGDYFDEDEAHWITRPDLYDLRPLPAGQRYVVIGNRIYVVNDSSYQIMSVLNAVSAILD